jgi:signal transduction histidine kinase
MNDSGDRLQRRLDEATRYITLPLLALSTAMAWISVRDGFGTWSRFDAGLVVVATAALWTALVINRSRERGAAARLVGFVVHAGLAAVLVGVNPWFGLFVISGYGLVDQLTPRWARLGLVVTALTLAASQAGGWPFGHSPDAWVGYLIIAAINATLVIAFTEVTNRLTVQNLERARMIGELNDANARLQAAIAENAGLHVQLVEQAREAGVQDERQRMAGEIHDTLAQGLAGIVTQLEAAEHSPDWRRHLEQARTLARSSLTEARRSVRALRPEQLEAATLVEAIDELACAWTATSRVPVHSEATGGVRPLADEVESTLFRVAQEGLSNVAKHASASKVWLTLTYLDDVVLLDLRDDGVGCADTSRGGYGLVGMRQRLARVGGQLEIETAPGEGTVVSASIPCVAA